MGLYKGLIERPYRKSLIERAFIRAFKGSLRRPFLSLEIDLRRRGEHFKGTFMFEPTYGPFPRNSLRHLPRKFPEKNRAF